MIQNITDEYRVARKDYTDDAGTFIRENLSDIRMNCKMTFTEWRAIAKLRANGWKILKGQRYNYQVNKHDELYVFRCLDEIGAICQKYELYPEY